MSDDTLSPCGNEDELIALALGEVSEPRKSELLAHLASCEPCAAVYADHQTLVGALAEQSRTKAVAHLDDVVKAARQVPQEGRWANVFTLRRTALATAVVALAAALAFRVGAPSDDPVARGNGTPPARLCRIEGTACNPLLAATRLAPDSRYSLESESRGPTPRFGLAFVVDARSDVHWVFPTWVDGPPPSAPPLPSGLFRDAVQFPTIAYGTAHAYVLTSEAPLGVAEVEKLQPAERTEAKLRARFPGARVSAIPIVIAAP